MAAQTIEIPVAHLEARSFVRSGTKNFSVPFCRPAAFNRWMDALDDMALLRRFTGENSDEAFALLVRRHLNLVYSAALRQVRNPSQADEITQAVFVILARRAASLPTTTVIPAWLYQTARLASTTLIRGEVRRARREQEAHLQSMPEFSDPGEAHSDHWEVVAPQLDAALAELGPADRTAIVLRFLQGYSLKEVAVALAASEDAAKKRISRAIDKLRRRLLRRGVAISGSILVGLISAHAIQAAPASLLPTTLAAAVPPVAKVAVAAANTSPLIQTTLQVMAWTKTKAVLGLAAGLLITTSVTSVVLTHGGMLRAASGFEDGAAPIPAPEADGGAQRRIVSNGLNKAHRIPGALYTYPDGDEVTRRYVENMVTKFRPDLDPALAFKSAGELTGDDLTNRTIYIYGSPSNHSLFRQVRTMLPIVFEADGVVVGNRKCLGRDVGAIFVCPNPFNVEHRLVVYGTVSPGSLREMNAVFHGPTDYVVFNDVTRKLETEGVEPGRCSLLAGAFDRSVPASWTAPARLQQAPAQPVIEATRGVVVSFPASDRR